MILLLLWINYTCQLIFFCAEFTKVNGYTLKPSKHAKWNPQTIPQEYNEEVVAGADLLRIKSKSDQPELAREIRLRGWKREAGGRVFPVLKTESEV